MKSLLLLAMASLFLLSGCNGQMVRFTQPDPAAYDFTRGRSVSAEACGFQLLLLIPINTNTRQLTAYERLRQAAGDSYIGDIRIKESWTYGFVGTMYCTEMLASAYPRLQAPAQKDDPAAVKSSSIPERLEILNKLKSSGTITEDEYQKKKAELLNSL